MKLPLVLAFTAMTAFFWGIYGIVLHRGTLLMDLKEETFQGEIGRSLRAFVGVGLAYFLIAVLVPVALLNRKRETGYWSVSGTMMSLFAGAVGALGALGVTLALSFKAQPIYVMPLVFGGAPVINTLLTSYLNKSFKQIKPMFLIGMLMVALGMIGVFVNKPQPPRGDVVDPINWVTVGLSIAMAILCWGSYGPFLHLGQSKMGGSRLRPFCCVGIAYFVIAVMIPIVALESMHSGSGYTAQGMMWSVLAGTAGAMGALGIILAFTFGGKPIFVMPLVFGFAPVINTITSIIEKGKFESLNGMFAVSLLLGISGAVTVLLNAPKSAPHGKPAEPKKPAADPAIAPNAASGAAGSFGSAASTASGQGDFSSPQESVKRPSGE
ncbi:MAG: hypothetical protein RL069_2603 [Planctomycetota bacterium]